MPQRPRPAGSIDSAHAEALRRFLAGRGWTTWNADSGWLRPFDDRFGEIRPSSNVWVRADAQSPWILDIPLTPFRDGLWVNKKATHQSMPLAEATWAGSDGLRETVAQVDGNHPWARLS